MALSLSLSSCAVPQGDEGGGGGDKPKETVASGTLYENVLFYSEQADARVELSKLFIGTDKDGKACGTGEGEALVNGVKKKVGAFYDGDKIHIYNRDDKTPIFIASAEELISAFADTYGVDLDELFNSEDGKFFKIANWYETELLGAVGNINYAVISEKINGVLSAIKAAVLTPEQAPDGNLSVELSSIELMALIDSYREKTVYDAVNELIKSAVENIPEDEIPEELSGVIKYTKLESVVSALLDVRIPIAQTMLEFKVAGGDIDKLTDALDSLTESLTGEKTLDGLIRKIFPPKADKEVIGIKDILKDSSTENVTVSNIIERISGYNRVDIILALDGLYNEMGRGSTGDPDKYVYGYLGISDGIESLYSALSEMGDADISLCLDELGNIKSFKISEKSQTENKNELKFEILGDKKYSFSLESDALLLKLTSKEVKNYKFIEEKVAATSSKYPITEQLVSEKYSGFSEYTLIKDNGKLISVSYVIDDGLALGQGKIKRTVYLDKVAAVLFSESELVYIMKAETEFESGAGSLGIGMKTEMFTVQYTSK